MRLIFSMSLMLLLSSSLFCEPVEIMYYHFFGDYLIENPYQIDVDIENMNLAQIKTILSNMRDNHWPIESDLAIVGYGQESSPKEFFAAFNSINDQTLFKQAFSSLPVPALGSRWYIYFVNDRISKNSPETKRPSLGFAC
jgi:hypothetical protein